MSYFSLLAETKYPMLKVKGRIIYLTPSLWRFQSIIHWLQDKVAHSRRATFHGGRRQQK